MEHSSWVGGQWIMIGVQGKFVEEETINATSMSYDYKIIPQWTLNSFLNQICCMFVACNSLGRLMMIIICVCFLFLLLFF